VDAICKVLQMDMVYLIEILHFDNFDVRQDFSHRSFHFISSNECMSHPTNAEQAILTRVKIHM